jgi:hypothetical protein
MEHRGEPAPFQQLRIGHILLEYKSISLDRSRAAAPLNKTQQALSRGLVCALSVEGRL